MAQFGDDQLKPDKDEDDDLFDKQLENKRKQKTDIFKLDELKSKHSILPPITVDEKSSNNATGENKNNQKEEIKVEEK